jgi:peroxiredoxin-like protein
MKPLPHVYEVRISGAASGYATAAADGIPDLRIAPPSDFDGPGDAWSPEHLLLAAVQSCLLLTFRSIAKASNLEFTALEISGAGTVDRRQGVTRFTEIVLRARLTVAADVDRDRARKLLEKAEKACLISASLSTPIRLEAEITIGTEATN